MVDINDTVTLSASASLDPHTPHDVTVSLGASARTFFSYGDHPQIPNNKMVYELDGTTVRYLRAPNGGGGEASASPWTEYLMTNAEIRALNNWGPGRYPHDNPYESYRYMFIFPEPRDIDYVCLSSGLGGGVGGNQYWRFYWSSNTTNGEDGTWTQVSVSTHQLYTSNYFLLRKRAYTDHLNLTNVRGVKMSIDHTLALMGNDGGRPHLVHLYGDKSVDSNRLALWHPTLDQEVSGDWFDWYNFEYGEDTRQFRIKNLSLTKRALNVTISMDSTNDPWSPAINTYHSLYNGGTWGPNITIDVLASQGISGIYTLKRSFPPGSPSTWFTMRLKAVAGVWETYIHNATTHFPVFGTFAGSFMREHNTTVQLTAGHTLTDGKLYRSSDVYRSLITYRGSKTTQSHTASGTFIAGGGTADGYLEEFIDAYGSAGLSAAAYILNKKATVSISAGPNGDNYQYEFTDAYGNSGLWAYARITEIHSAQATLSATASITTDAVVGPLITGGTVTDSGGYRYHLFASSDSLVAYTNATVEALIVAGGAGGHADGAGGAGGVLYMSSASLTPQTYTVTVGSGGTGVNNGNNSSLGSVGTAIGGGRGGSIDQVGQSGGSGGGGGMNTQVGGVFAGGSGTSGQGYAGGTTPGLANSPCGGGGGAGAVGANGYNGNGGAGGAGTSAYSTWGSVCGVGHNVSGTYYFGGGGGGPCWVGTGGLGGNGGGGRGVQKSGATLGYSGQANTGGGGGGGYSTTGGSGVVIIRYPIPS